MKRLQGPNATAPAPSSWKRSKLQRDLVDGGDVEEEEEEETVAKRGASNSVLMNLLVSGCDVSAGYACFTKPKNAAASSSSSSCSSSRFYYETAQRRDISAK